MKQEVNGKTRKSKSDEYAREIYRLYAGGLLAIILVLLQGLLALPSFDGWIIVSMLASAVAIPPLSGVLVVAFVEKHFQYADVRSASSSSRAVTSVSALGFLAGLVAIATAFGHVLPLVMEFFVGSLLLTTGIYLWYVSHLDDKP